MLMLAVNIHQAFGDFFENGDGHQPAIDAALRFAACPGQFARDQQRVFLLLGIQARFRQSLPHFRRRVCQVKDCFHRGFAGPGTDQIRSGPFAQSQPEGINDDGLSRAGFAGQDIQARPERQIQAVNQGKIRDMKLN